MSNARADFHHNGLTIRALIIGGNHWLDAEELARTFGDLHEPWNQASTFGITPDEMTREMIDGEEVVLFSASALYKIATVGVDLASEPERLIIEERDRLLEENRKLRKLLHISLCTSEEMSEAA